jgi:4-hydroxybenzoate polyprenyltransferase
MTTSTPSPVGSKTSRIVAGLFILVASVVTLPLIATAANPTTILAVLSLLVAIVLLVLQFRSGGRRV